MADTTAYTKAGVNVEAGYESTRLMKEDVRKTLTPYVLSELGGFGGLVALPEGMKNPVLVSGTDGVGTKLMIAQEMGVDHTVGIDAVAMCVNDIICQGAKPLFFLDYIACGHNEPRRIADIVAGVAEGCVQSNCALVGGETAEMPGMYGKDDYDIAGFAVGCVDRDEIITGEHIKAGDRLVGIASTGVHSNGFSLIRKIIKDRHLDLKTIYAPMDRPLGEVLLTPTKIYVKATEGLIRKYGVLGMSHITGGGFYENIPRMLPEGLGAKIDRSAIPVLPVFKFLMRMGDLSLKAMYSTFNMGVGLVAALPADMAEAFAKEVTSRGIQAAVIGEVVPCDTDERVQIEGVS